MADTKISGLTAVAAALGAQELPCNDAATTKKVTLAQIKAALQAGGDIALALAGLSGFKSALSIDKTATETVNNSTTLQNDNHLSLMAASAAKYRLELFMRFTDASVAGAGGVKLSIAGTATYTNMALSCEVHGTQGFSGIVSSTWLSSSSDEAFGTGDGQYTVLVYGLIDVNAGGTVAIEWAQQVALAADLVAQVGSYLMLTEL